MNMNITANPNASNRTKNRIREHKGEFKFATNTSIVNVDGIGPSRLFLSLDDKWMGWLPVSEINILD